MANTTQTTTAIERTKQHTNNYERSIKCMYVGVTAEQKAEKRELKVTK